MKTSSHSVYNAAEKLVKAVTAHYRKNKSGIPFQEPCFRISSKCHQGSHSFPVSERRERFRDTYYVPVTNSKSISFRFSRFKTLSEIIFTMSSPFVITRLLFLLKQFQHSAYYRSSPESGMYSISKRFIIALKGGLGMSSFYCMANCINIGFKLFD